MQPCERCDGRGHTQQAGDDSPVVLVECTCNYARCKRAFLGDELFEAPRLVESPLGPELTARNVRITGEWSTVAPHLRRALGVRWHRARLAGDAFSFAVVTDWQIVNSSVTVRKDLPALHELMTAEKDLIILRVGRLGHPNKAAGGYLHEALMNRAGPLWFVDTPRRPFRSGHLSFSDDAADHIANWRHIKIKESDGTAS